LTPKSGYVILINSNIIGKVITLIQSGGGTGPMKPGNQLLTARCQFLQEILPGR
jgi:hypothetical protein